jgi:uncharacterized protein
VTFEWKSGELAEGVRCYRNEEFWQAHEHWESVWLRLLQSLIQISAAFHHLKSGNTRGTASLLRRALLRLELYPAQFGGVDLTLLRKETGEWLSAIESQMGSCPDKFPQIWPD